MRIYLDNAATSWPKPEAVYAAVDRYQRDVGAAGGRSGYREAIEANRIIDRVRRGVAKLIGVNDPRRIIFGANGTDMLNIAIRGLVRPGDHVVTTVCEHNSVLRPLRSLREKSEVEVTYVPCDGQGIVSPDDVRRVLTRKTRLVAVVHASNVTGAIQPVEAISAVAREHGALLLVDAAQSLGHEPMSAGGLGADLLAAPGHKGLLGPLGTGILYIGPGVESRLEPLRCGGTGTHSDEDRQPESLPDKYEPGNHNVLGLAGLAAACDFLAEQTIAVVRSHQAELTARMLRGLSEISGVTVYGPRTASNRTSVVSFTAAAYEPQEFAAALESAYRIQCRAGIHCAPRMHAALGTLAGGGLVRLSCGWSTTAAEIDRTVEAIAAIAAA